MKIESLVILEKIYECKPLFLKLEKKLKGATFANSEKIFFKAIKDQTLFDKAVSRPGAAIHFANMAEILKNSSLEDVCFYVRLAEDAYLSDSTALFSLNAIDEQDLSYFIGEQVNMSLFLFQNRNALSFFNELRRSYAYGIDLVTVFTYL